MEKGDVFLTPLTVPERQFGEVDFFLMMVTTAVYDAIMFLAVCVCVWAFSKSIAGPSESPSALGRNRLY